MLIGACHPRLSALIPRLQDYPAGTEANTRAVRQLNFIIFVWAIFRPFGPFWGTVSSTAQHHPHHPCVRRMMYSHLLGVPVLLFDAYSMLIAACNPMVCPVVHGVQAAFAGLYCSLLVRADPTPFWSYWTMSPVSPPALPGTPRNHHTAHAASIMRHPPRTTRRVMSTSYP